MRTDGITLKASLGQSAMRCLRLLRDSAALWLPVVIALHILILLHAAQWYAYAAFAGDFSHPLRYLKWSIELWYTRAALAPLVVYFALRHRFDPKRWLRCLVIYTVITLALATVASAVQVEAVTRLHTSKYFVAGTEGSPSPVVASGLESFAIKGWTHLIYNMFACWMLLGLVQGISYYRDAQRRELESSRLQTQLATMQLEILRMQLNPHFLFNTLHAISTLIKDEPQVAEDMILQLSDLLRSILDCNHLQEIPLRRELHFIESYLAIEQARFGDRLTTSIDVPEELLHCPVPQLILQPLIENAIHHGIGENAGTDLIEIRAEEKEGTLQLEVRNVNGVLRRAPDVCLRSGIGLSNTILRLEALYPNRARLQVEKAIPSGVAATILIPMNSLRDTVDECEQVLTQ